MASQLFLAQGATATHSEHVGPAIRVANLDGLTEIGDGKFEFVLVLICDGAIDVSVKEVLAPFLFGPANDPAAGCNPLICLCAGADTLRAHEQGGRPYIYARCASRINARRAYPGDRV